MAVKKTTEDAFSMAAFDPSKFADNFRDMADKSAEKSREAYGKMKEVAEDATKTIEATMQSAQAGTVELGLKTIDAVRANAEASLAHAEALLGVKSVSELFELQTAFFRKQAETAMTQVKTLQEASRVVAEKVAKPGKDAAEKVMSSFKLSA